MKKYIFLTVIVLLAIGTASAQGWTWSSPQIIRVDGTLQLLNGQIALTSGSTVYYVPTLGRYIGFIDGLREGARISALGYASGNLLQLTQFTIDGREYDLQPANVQGWGAGVNGWCCHNSYGAGNFHRGASRRGRW